MKDIMKVYQCLKIYWINYNQNILQILQKNNKTKKSNKNKNNLIILKILLMLMKFKIK